MRRLVTLLLIASVAMPASAATYKWVDASGTVNFAEDLGKVPKKYRKKVVVLGEEGHEPAMPAPKAVPPVREAPREGREKEKPVVSPPQETKKEYGGKDQEAWKNELGQVAADVKSAEEQLVELRKRAAEPGAMSRSEYLGLQYEIRNVEKKIVQLRKVRDTLHEEADRAGVPAALRP